MLLVSSSWWEQEGDMLIIIMCGVCVVVCLPVVALFLLLNPESRNKGVIYRLRNMDYSALSYDVISMGLCITPSAGVGFPDLFSCVIVFFWRVLF